MFRIEVDHKVRTYFMGTSYKDAWAYAKSIFPNEVADGRVQVTL